MATSPDRPSLEDELRAVAARGPLARIGVTDVEPFEDVRRSLERRRQAGHHGGMSFTFSSPRRSTEPHRLLRNARSLVVGALGYHEATPDRPAGPVASVARYAWRDHYAVLRDALGALADVLRAHGHRAAVFADQNALVDRAAAHRAGIGWWGRNSNLLVPGHGSWFVLGSVVTDAELAPEPTPVPDGCRSCTACITACPTGAIVDDGVIDARRCLAWLVQDAGVFPRAHRVALGDRIYGCDDCQDCCPPSRRNPAPDVIDVRVGDPDAHVDLLDLLAADDATLMDRHGRWYIPKRDPVYLRRNALVALGNVGDPADPRVRATVETATRHAHPLVRSHAVWAAARLGLHDVVAAAAEDDDARVRAEVALAPEVPPRLVGSTPRPTGAS